MIIRHWHRPVSGTYILCNTDYSVIGSRKYDWNVYRGSERIGNSDTLAAAKTVAEQYSLEDDGHTPPPSADQTSTALREYGEALGYALGVLGTIHQIASYHIINPVDLHNATYGLECISSYAGNAITRINGFLPEAKEHAESK